MHCIIDANVIPSVHVFCSINPNIHTSILPMFVAFNLIKSDLCSKLFVLDFEKIDMNAVVHVHLETQVKGCFFSHGSIFLWSYSRYGTTKKNI